MERFATVDVGSYSVLLLVAERKEGGFRYLVDKAVVTRLGEGLYRNRKIKPEAMERTIGALKRFRGIMEGCRVKGVAAVGTMALREAENAEEFLERAKKEAGLTIEVIPAEEEARLSYLGAISGLPLFRKRGFVVDIGGGSTEFVLGEGSRILERSSLKVGALTLTETFLRSDPVRAEEFSDLSGYLKEAFDRAGLPAGGGDLVGLGGNIATMAAVKQLLTDFDPSRVHGTLLDLSEVKRQIDLYLSRTIEERKKIPGLDPMRADTILAGAAILHTVMERLRRDSITVSTHGLRHGLLLERFG